MKKRIKIFVKKILARKMDILDDEIDMLFQKEVFVTLLTDKDKLLSLIRNLFPVKVEGKELVRIGNNRDGGYLIPDDFEGIEACFSLGVGYMSKFEKDCANRGMKVFMADKTVEQSAETDRLFHFTKKNVGVTTSDDMMTIDDWVSSSLPNTQSDLLLQIDIEGAEYEVILGMSDSLMKRCRIIVVEFHGLENLLSQPFFQIASRAFDKILQSHACVHIHPNNYCETVVKKGLVIPGVLEFTFLQTDRIETPSFAGVFPHPLDADSATDRPTLILPKCWYRNP